MLLLKRFKASGFCWALFAGYNLSALSQFPLTVGGFFKSVYGNLSVIMLVGLQGVIYYIVYAYDRISFKTAIQHCIYISPYFGHSKLSCP
jgi:hypothetical protein